MIFDPDTVGPDEVARPRLPQQCRPLDLTAQGRARHHRPAVPIVLDGELQTDVGLPGHVLSPS